MNEENEVPWWPTPPNATLKRVGDRQAILTFHSPKDFEICRIGVSLDDTSSPEQWDKAVKGGQYYGWVWKIDKIDVGLITVSPSIHYHGIFHSASPVQFNVTDIR